MEKKDNNYISRKQKTKNQLVRQRFMPIFIHDDLDSKMLVAGAVEAGCMVLEYTCRRHDAREIIPWIKREYPHVAVFGASLVDGPKSSLFLSKHRPNFITIEEIVDLGVDGLISFLKFRPETYERYTNDLVMIPGVHTYNEALEQLELGADFVKILGNTPYGAKIISFGRKATHELFPIMITGGMTEKTIPQFIKEGATLVTAGFDVILKKEIEKGEGITQQVVSAAVKRYIDATRESQRRYWPEYYAILGGSSQS